MTVSADPAVPSPPGDPIVARLRAGDESAFEEVVRAHGGRMLAAARRLLRDDHEAEDAVQDAFLSAFRSVAEFDGRSGLGTWLHRIAVNAALQKLRARSRRHEEPIDDLLPRWMEYGHFETPPAAWQEDASGPAEREETRAVVRAAIDRLPETYRTALILRDVEQLSTAESAASLGIEEAALKVRLHRARQALRTLLDPHFRRDA